MTREEAKAIETWAWSIDELEAEDRMELFRKLIHGLVDNASPIMIEAVLDLMMKDDEELDDPAFHPTRYPTKPEVIYTGGGIWLSVAWIAPERYAVIGNDDECAGFAVYDSTLDEAGERFPCQGYVDWIDGRYFTPCQKKLYTALHTALVKGMN